MRSYDPHNLTHLCGGPVKTTEFDGEWSAVCRGCGAVKSGCKTAEELMLKWHGLKPEREFAEGIERAIGRLVEYLAGYDGEVYSRELIAVAGEGGRRALEILNGAGLVKSRFEIEQGSLDASFEEAAKAKENGKKVMVFCRRNFKLLETT